MHRQLRQACRHACEVGVQSLLLRCKPGRHLGVPLHLRRKRVLRERRALRRRLLRRGRRGQTRHCGLTRRCGIGHCRGLGCCPPRWPAGPGCEQPLLLLALGRELRLERAPLLLRPAPLLGHGEPLGAPRRLGRLRLSGAQPLLQLGALGRRALRRLRRLARARLLRLLLDRARTLLGAPPKALLQALEPRLRRGLRVARARRVRRAHLRLERLLPLLHRHHALCLHLERRPLLRLHAKVKRGSAQT